jgi:hypothetical protein
LRVVFLWGILRCDERLRAQRHAQDKGRWNDDTCRKERTPQRGSTTAHVNTALR